MGRKYFPQFVLQVVYNLFLFFIFRLSDYISGGILAEGLSVARYDKSIPQSLNVELSFQSTAYQTENDNQWLNIVSVLVDRMSVFDTEGNV